MNSLEDGDTITPQDLSPLQQSEQFWWDSLKEEMEQETHTEEEQQHNEPTVVVTPVVIPPKCSDEPELRRRSATDIRNIFHQAAEIPCERGVH